MSPGRYWVKLWIETLDDPKVATLSDRLWRRWIETLLMADAGGQLPELSVMAWRLRMEAEALESDLVELARPGLTEQREGRWWIPKFPERQAPKTGTERWRLHQRYGVPNEAPTKRQRTAPTEEKRGQKTEERKRARLSPEPPKTHPAVQVFREETQRYPKKATQPEIENLVGRHEEELALWRRIVHEWVALGWNPVNVRGMLECFTRQEIPSVKRGGKQTEPKSFEAIRQAKAEMEARGGE